MHIAALFTFLVFITDILYALKAPFTEDYMKQVVGLLAFRYGLLIIVQFWWLYRNNAASSLQSRQNSSSSNN